MSPSAAARRHGGQRRPLALVAQWIEHRPPEPGAQVRVLPGAPRVTDTSDPLATTKAATGYRYRRERVYHSAPWRAAAAGDDVNRLPGREGPKRPVAPGWEALSPRAGSPRGTCAVVWPARRILARPQPSPSRDARSAAAGCRRARAPRKTATGRRCRAPAASPAPRAPRERGLSDTRSALRWCS